MLGVMLGLTGVRGGVAEEAWGGSPEPEARPPSRNPSQAPGHAINGNSVLSLCGLFVLRGPKAE